MLLLKLLTIKISDETLSKDKTPNVATYRYDLHCRKWSTVLKN